MGSVTDVEYEIEPAFEADVDLLTETCAACGLVLGLSADWLGTIADTGDGVPVVQLWHEACATTDLQAAHADAMVVAN